jgi:recombination protein RecT
MEMTDVQTASTSALAERIADRAKNPIGTGETLQEFIRAQQGELGKGLPPGVLTAERFVRTVLTEVRRNPGLGSCTRDSFLGAMFQAAQLGLEPGSALGQAYLIPYNNNVKGPDGEWHKVMECQFQIGYKGWIAIGARSGILLESREVRERDEFRFKYGTSAFLEHEWDPEIEDRGKIVCYYGTAEFANGRTRFHVMSLADIERRRERSGAVRAGKNSPWSTDLDAMCKKTVIRAMINQLPMAAELQEAASVDEGISVRRETGEMRVSFPAAIDVPSTPALSEEAEELLAIIEETEPPAEKINLSDYLFKTFGPVTTLTPEQIAEATNIALGWPDTKPDAQEPADSAPPSPADDDPGPEEPPAQDETPTESLAGVPDEIARRVTTSIATWDEETVKQKLREWNVPFDGRSGIGKLRTALMIRLAPELANRNPAAEALF